MSEGNDMRGGSCCGEDAATIAPADEGSGGMGGCIGGMGGMGGSGGGICMYGLYCIRCDGGTDAPAPYMPCIINGFIMPGSGGGIGGLGAIVGGNGGRGALTTEFTGILTDDGLSERTNFVINNSTNCSI